MRPLRYLYFRLYQLMIEVGNKDVAEYYAALLMAFLIGLNLYSASFFIYVLTGQKINLTFNSKYIILIEYFGLAWIFFLLFVKNNKYLEIEKIYADETTNQKYSGKIFSITYFILSIVLVFIGFYLMLKKNRGEL